MINDVIVANAKKYLGKPYVWGGESDAEGGYDCSGLTYVTLRDSGIKGSRTTAQGYYNRYRKNEASKNTVGALLFFGSGKTKITHVAISIGGGKMIESRGSSKNTKANKGLGVVISNISRRNDFVYAATPFEVSIIPVLASAKKNLKQGSRGTEVRYLQEDLNYVINAKLETDGRFGPLTKKALMDFQKKYPPLVVDGIYGRHSYNTMKGLLL